MATFGLRADIVHIIDRANAADGLNAAMRPRVTRRRPRRRDEIKSVNESTRLSAALTFAWGGAVLFALSLAYFLYSYLVRFGERAETATSPVRAAAIDVLLFGIFAAHHSFLARPPVKAHIRRFLGTLLERSIYTWTASALFIVVCAFWQFVPGELYHLTDGAALPGFGLQMLGAVLTGRSSAKLDVLDLAGVRSVLRARHGQEEPHVALETRGLYGFVRHPIYFAWLLIVFGTPHMTATRLTFAIVSTVYLAIAIPFEERSLIQTFGEEYRRYQQRVRWRMVPGVY